MSKNIRHKAIQDRRRFLTLLGGASVGLVASGCSEQPSPARYNQSDINLLANQYIHEKAQSGKGRFGSHIYQGYRGLADLPWFELDQHNKLILVDQSVPNTIDLHCHLGMSVLFKPELDLAAKTKRVRHLLDCDKSNPGCDLDLDVYVNANFSKQELDALPKTLFTQGLWGNDIVRTHTLSNLLAEMDTMRVEKAALLPIKMGLPFGDALSEMWAQAIKDSGKQDRFIQGGSVHPKQDGNVEEVERLAASGAKMLKLHPTVQKFYPDDDALMPVYERAQQLGLIIFFHGGRAGIEPDSSQPYAMPRHYEKAIANFPNLQFMIGHGGARDGNAMLELALRYRNVWLGIHGQGISHLDKMISKTNGERLLFGSDWPFYHIGASLAKVLITTQTSERSDIREAILNSNAKKLLSLSNA